MTAKNVAWYYRHMNNSSEPKNTNEIGKITKEMYSEGTREVLQMVLSETKPYTTSVLGREFVVFPNVFSPKYFNDTELFAKNLPIRKGDKVLEIGSGTGAVVVSAVLKGADEAVAVDINSDAVVNTKENVSKFGLDEKISVLQGNVYDPVPKGKKFSAIFWNVPFELIERENISDIEKSVYDPGYKSITRFITEAHEYLEPSGRLYVGFSTTLGDYNLLKKIADSAGYDLPTIYSVQSTEVHPVKFEIIEAIKRKA